MTDELAALFASKMAMGAPSITQHPTQIATPPTPTLANSPPTTVPSSQSAPITHSITQHYHHSSHLLLSGSRNDQSMGEEVDGTFMNGDESGMSTEEVLMKRGIDPATLFASQMELFRQADSEQRNRLVELWRISPQMTASQNQHSAAGGQAQGITAENEEDMMTDYEPNHAEPYVVSGYESLAQQEYERSANQPTSSSAPASHTVLMAPSQTYTQATDPAYRGAWNQQQTMADQYGAYEAKRYYIGCGISRAHWLDDAQMF